MRFLADLLKGGLAHGEDILGKIKDDPERLFLGGLDPIGGELWGGMLGKDYEPAVSMLGGATDQQFKGMEAKGINTGPKRGVDAIADAIAMTYAGGALQGGAGAGGAEGGNALSDIMVDTTQRSSDVFDPSMLDRAGGFLKKAGSSVMENPQVQGQIAQSVMNPPAPPPAAGPTSLRSSFTAGQNPYEVARERAMRRMRTRRRF